MSTRVEVEIDGVIYPSVSEAAREFGLYPQELRKRLAKGLTGEELRAGGKPPHKPPQPSETPAQPKENPIIAAMSGNGMVRALHFKEAGVIVIQKLPEPFALVGTTLSHHRHPKDFIEAWSDAVMKKPSKQILQLALKLTRKAR